MSDSLRSSLKTAVKGAALVFAGMIVSQALWFVTRLLLVRNLSKEDLGIYSMVVGIISIVSLLASLGLWEGATRYIAIFLGQGRKEDADYVQRSSLRIGVIAGAGACAVFFLLAGVLAKYAFYKPELSLPLTVMSFYIPAFVMAYILSAIVRGYGDISPRVYFMDIGQPFFFLVLLCFILLFGLPFINIICAYVFSMSAVCVLIALYGHQKTRVNPFAFWRSGGYVKALLKFSVPVLFFDAMSLIFRWADTLMLGRYGSAEQVGVYSVSVSLAAFLTLPLFALDTIYMPVAGELFAKNRSADLARTYEVLTKWIFAVTLPLFFILFFFPEMTIIFLFGERFSDAALSLRILSVGFLFNAFLGTNAMLLLVMGFSKAVMKVAACGTLLNIILNYILIKQIGLGMTGAALASMVSFLVIGLGYSFVLYRRSGMHPFAAGYLKPVIGSALIGVVIYVAAKSLPLYSWMLPVYFLLYICGYIASLVFTRSVDDEDVLLLEALLKRAGVAPEVTRGIAAGIHKWTKGKINTN